MSMTAREKKTKEYILKILDSEGYPTYADILYDFDVNLTKNPSVVGFMEPSKGRIVLNEGLNIDQVSVIIRHEILHFYFEHEMRLLRHLAENHNLDYDSLEVGELQNLKQELYGDKTFNYAADYEISNRAYTEKDKQTVRQIELNGQILQGLVTEDDHPDWVGYSVEEMYDALKEASKNLKNDVDKAADNQQDDQGSSNKSDSADQQDQAQDDEGSDSDSSSSSSSDSSQSSTKNGKGGNSSQGGSDYDYDDEDDEDEDDYDEDDDGDREDDDEDDDYDEDAKGSNARNKSNNGKGQNDSDSSDNPSDSSSDNPEQQQVNKPKIIYGHLVDDQTFRASDGSIIQH